MDNIYLDDYLISKLMAEEWSIRTTTYNSQKSLPIESKGKGFRVRSSCRERIVLLEEQNLKYANKMEEIAKEQKELREQKSVLLQKMSVLKAEK